MKIFVANKNEANVASIERMMNSVGLKPSIYTIVDVSEPQEDIDTKHLLAFGKKAVMHVVNLLIKNEYIAKGTYIGKPLIDEDNAFFFYGIPLEVPEIMKDDGNKFYVFEILSDLAQYYLKWCPFNDELNFTNLPRDCNGEVNGESDNISVPIDSSSDNLIPREHALDSLELIAKLIEKVDFSDVGMGRSLSKFEKIQLITNNGYKLNISPTARETISTDEKEIDINYKDLLSLLKVIVLTGSRSIEFFK